MTSDEKQIQTDNMLHEQIMAKLSRVRGYESTTDSFEGSLACWKVEALNPNEVIEIAKRGNHEEIMYMIHQYGKAGPMYDWTHGRPSSPYGEEHILPINVQATIASRCDWEEIMAYISYQGFGEYAQSCFLKKADHAMRMAYLAKHGLTPINQQKLLEDGNAEECELHLKRHGFCSDIEYQMLAEQNFDRFKAYVDVRELSVAGQKRLCRDIPPLFFTYYTQKYGLWEDAHDALVTYRNDDEIVNYVIKHRHLSNQAEQLLCKNHKHRVLMTYIWHKWASPLSLIEPLKQETPIDYLVILGILEKEKHHDNVKELEVELMRSGSREQVEEYLLARYPTPEAKKALQERIRTDSNFKGLKLRD